MNDNLQQELSSIAKGDDPDSSAVSNAGQGYGGFFKDNHASPGKPTTILSPFSEPQTDKQKNRSYISESYYDDEDLSANKHSRGEADVPMSDQYKTNQQNQEEELENSMSFDPGNTPEKNGARVNNNRKSQVSSRGR